jgi:hypothetical protein
MMLFLKLYLETRSLNESAKQAGISCQASGVDWACFVRELFKEYVSKEVFQMQLSGTIEVDESIFGRRRKYNRGVNSASQVWIVGLIERDTNRIILDMYPVDDQETLETIITRHVEKGTYIIEIYHLSLKYLNVKMTDTHSFRKVALHK